MLETATLGGGCFWCTEAIFKRLKGVESVVSGYAGGEKENPTYQEVSSGKTGYIESIQIKFDPSTISYEHILDIFWATHDPTSKDKQGADVGSQYRSVIFYHNEEQRKKAQESMEKIQGAVTQITGFKNFYTAEEYHQNFYDKNKSTNMYCSLVIDPKIKKLLDKFGKDVKEEYKETS
ncbi:MAG TPA: peptide-methionine (S)-S-oxide reductase MsrA [Patescibacteria group bacterium]